MAQLINWEKIFSNVTPALGLDPKAAAEGRAIQAQSDLADEKSITEREHRPIQSNVYTQQARNYGASADANVEKGLNYKATAGKTQAETVPLTRGNDAQEIISKHVSDGNIILDTASGAWKISPNASPEARKEISRASFKFSQNPETIRKIAALFSEDARDRSVGFGDPGALEPDAAATTAQGRAVMSAKSAAENEKQRIANQGNLAVAVEAGKSKIAAAIKAAEIANQGRGREVDHSKNIGAAADFERQVNANLPGLDSRTAAKLGGKAMKIENDRIARGEQPNPQQSAADAILEEYGTYDPVGEGVLVDRNAGSWRPGAGVNLVPGRALPARPNPPAPNPPAPNATTTSLIPPATTPTILPAAFVPPATSTSAPNLPVTTTPTISPDAFAPAAILPPAATTANTIAPQVAPAQGQIPVATTQAQLDDFKRNAPRGAKIIVNGEELVKP